MGALVPLKWSAEVEVEVDVDVDGDGAEKEKGCCSGAAGAVELKEKVPVRGGAAAAAGDCVGVENGEPAVFLLGSPLILYWLASDYCITSALSRQQLTVCHLCRRKESDEKR